MSRVVPRRIGIVLHDDQFVTRGVLRGVMKYVAENPGWSTLGGTSPACADSVFQSCPPDGIITSFEPQMNQRVPTVAVVYPHSSVARVAMDDALTGVLAVEHFRQRGFRHFAFVGYGRQWWSGAREAGFVSAVRRLMSAAIGTVPSFTSGRFHPGRWQITSRDLVAWLSELPKPVAVFACNDTRARETINAALSAKVRVPEDVAVLGVDNDDLQCEMSLVPLSSIVYPCEEVGYQAAARLARILDGRRTASLESVLVPATRIQTRRSTDVLAVEDAAVAGAYRFMQDHASEPIRVTDVAHGANVAERTLQLRYRRVLNRSIHDDILQNRISLATELLANSRLPLKEVASRAGFCSDTHLSTVFRKKLHITPGSLRRHHFNDAF